MKLARVSNPANQDNHDTGERLLRYCIRNSHWSIFEMVHWTVEIETSRAVSAQLLRHQSFRFQEFSQRYASVAAIKGEGSDIFEPIELRLRGDTNRQGSKDEVLDNSELQELVNGVLADSEYVYDKLLAEGVAPECARMVLPLATRTRLYMCGNVRSWIHYLNVRMPDSAQKEHRLVARAISRLFEEEFPITHAAAITVVHE